MQAEIPIIVSLIYTICQLPLFRPEQTPTAPVTKDRRRVALLVLFVTTLTPIIVLTNQVKFGVDVHCQAPKFRDRPARRVAKEI